MKEARHRRASSFQCTKRLPAERGAQIAPIFAITNCIEHQDQDVEVRLKALHRNSHRPRQAMETVAEATGYPPLPARIHYTLALKSVSDAR
jgi:hypothetical protein